jgi:hypothetical protein
MLTSVRGRRYHPPPPDGPFAHRPFSCTGSQEDRNVEGSHSHPDGFKKLQAEIEHLSIDRRRRDRRAFARRVSSATSPRAPSTTRRRTSRPISRPASPCSRTDSERARRHEEEESIGRGLRRHEGASARREGEQDRRVHRRLRRSNPAENKLSNESPVGKAIMGRRRARPSRSPRRAATTFKIMDIKAA